MDEFSPYLSSETGKSNMHDAEVGGHERNCFAHLRPFVSCFLSQTGLTGPPQSRS